MKPRRRSTPRSTTPARPRAEARATRLNPRDATLPRIASARIERDRLIPSGTTVLVAVSGGADSMALLHFLATERPRPSGGDGADGTPAGVAAAHVNHGVRGADADQDARFVRGRAAAWGVPYFEATIPKGSFRAKGGGGAPEEAMRRLRYEALGALAAEAGADRVATAHTADDQAETVLLRMARGAGLRGLAGMPPRGLVHGARVIRPLLDVTREQVLAYLGSHGIEHREDASNEVLTAARNAVRREILPALRARLNPSIREALLREAALFREVDDHLEAEARGLLAACLLESSDRKIVLDRERLLSYPKLLRSYVFRCAVQELNGVLREFATAHIDALHSLVTQSSDRSADLPLGLMARREGRRVVIARRKREPGRRKGPSNSGDIGPSCRSMKGTSTE